MEAQAVISRCRPENRIRSEKTGNVTLQKRSLDLWLMVRNFCICYDLTTGRGDKQRQRPRHNCDAKVRRKDSDDNGCDEAGFALFKVFTIM